MFGEEIEVPKELREFMIQGAQETKMGQKNGSIRQYRYGKLHIREYDDKFLVHTDKVDPREDALGHLIHDAPEFLVGLACAVGGTKLSSALRKNKSPLTSILGSIVFGYTGYIITKKLKDSKVM